MFKGDANDCWATLFLLHYYMERLLMESGRGSPKTVSYGALIAECREISRLQNRTELITDAREVLRLAHRQRTHQQAFVAAYSVECVRPKHHHRMHLPRDILNILKLGFVPTCSPMEKKHRDLKSGKVMDNLQAYVNRFEDAEALSA